MAIIVIAIIIVINKGAAGIKHAATVHIINAHSREIEMILALGWAARYFLAWASINLIMLWFVQHSWPYTVSSLCG